MEALFWVAGGAGLLLAAVIVSGLLRTRRVQMEAQAGIEERLGRIRDGEAGVDGDKHGPTREQYEAAKKRAMARSWREGVTVSARWDDKRGEFVEEVRQR